MPDTNIDTRIQQLHARTKSLIENGADDKAIVTALLQEGIDEHYAITIIENVKNDFRDKKEFRKHILSGSFVVIAGLLINYLSYRFAERTGTGSFLLIWGIVVAGIITIIRGFILFKK